MLFAGSKDADFGLDPKKSWAIMMDQWVGAQDQVKIAKNTSTCGVPPENPPLKLKIFFFDFDYKTCWIHRGFEQLSSSIAWRVIGLQSSARNVVFAWSNAEKSFSHMQSNAHMPNVISNTGKNQPKYFQKYMETQIKFSVEPTLNSMVEWKLCNHWNGMHSDRM